jgi:hypothetical protein
MASREVRTVSERVLSRLDVRRRDFIKQLIVGTTFVAPVMTSLSLGSPALAPRAAHAAPPQTTELELETIADTSIRSDAVNRNDGGNALLRVSSGVGTWRVLVKFDDADMRAAARGAVAVRLTLDRVRASWGEGRDRTVAAHALSVDFTEGNGRPGMGDAVFVGSGPGATWNTPEDLDISNNTMESVREPWSGGDFIFVPTAITLHPSEVTGPVSWDVTADVRAGITRWLLKVTTETSAGVLEYFSRDADPAPDASMRAPRLIFRYAAGS